MFIFFDFGHYIGRGRRSKIGGGDKLFTSWKELLARSERVSSQVGESIIPGRKEYLSGCKEVPSPLLPLGSAALSSLVAAPCYRTTITPLVVRL